MADQLGDVVHRLEGIGQFSSVVSAIRGMAAVRLKEAQERLEGILSYEQTVAEAIGEALVLLPQNGASASGSPSGGVHLVIAICSEQGFVGGFNGQILDAVEALPATQAAACELFVIGNRGVVETKERGLEVNGTMPMAAHADEVMTQANRLVEELYRRLEREEINRVTLVHAGHRQSERAVVNRPLIPFDFLRFPAAAPAEPPLLNLPPQALLEALAQEYVFAEICEAIMLSYAAENEARMYAMLAARNNIDHRLDELTALVRRLRQEQITSEVVELAVSAEASLGAGR
ncbi:MAG: F0F1 ATP synthase subunit gamma [Novosphingobium sp.]|nr:F0F1 ATP synthase subunit gamma [Novosphingobium sp.]